MSFHIPNEAQLINIVIISCWLWLPACSAATDNRCQLGTIDYGEFSKYTRSNLCQRTAMVWKCVMHANDMGNLLFLTLMPILAWWCLVKISVPLHLEFIDTFMILSNNWTLCTFNAQSLSNPVLVPWPTNIMLIITPCVNYNNENTN